MPSVTFAGFTSITVWTFFGDSCFSGFKERTLLTAAVFAGVFFASIGIIIFSVSVLHLLCAVDDAGALELPNA